MSTDEGARLASFSRAVRESSLERFRAVPRGRETWRPKPGAMSCADLAQHLVDADRWLFAQLREGDLEPLTGRPYAAAVADRIAYHALLAELEQTGAEREELLRRTTAERLRERIRDRRFGGPVSAWWIILRGNLDHEIHHRGQLAGWLQVMGREGHVNGPA